jgi:hypothetical protein
MTRGRPYRWVRPLVVSFAALIALAVTAAPSEAAFPGNNGKLLAGRGPWFGMGTIYPNGARISVLLYGEDYSGAWSPDGTKVAYQENGNDETPARTYILDVAAGTTIRLPDDLYDPAWSPDGTKLVFSGGLVANADGSLGTPIPNVGGQPAWSADGTKIAFTRSESFLGYDVYTINVDGSGLTNLTNDPAQQNGSPDWSPDSTKLTYAQGSTRQIWRMNRDGSGKTALTATSSAQNSGSPVWSPDGSKIAYSDCFPNGTCNIHMLNLGVSNTLVTRIAGSQLDWQSCATPCPPPPPPPYDAPQAATTLDVPLVPNFRQTISSTQCTARGGLNSTHGAPLSLPSCNPPAFLPGTVAHFGSNNERIPSNVKLQVRYGNDNLADGDQADLGIGAGVYDILTATGDPYLPNPTGPDITLAMKLRITDSYNGASLDTPATVSDFELGIPIDCMQFPNREPNCDLFTSMDALQPGLIRENGATVIQTYIARVKDSGVNGVRGDSDDRQFGMQGYTVALRTPG